MPTGPVKADLMRKAPGLVWSGELQGMALQAWYMLRGTLQVLCMGRGTFFFPDAADADYSFRPLMPQLQAVRRHQHPSELPQLSHERPGMPMHN